MNKNIFTKKEYILVIMLSLALGIRQMTMTLVMPFISTYSKTLSNNTPALAGVALGIFGLTQAIFQIPYGILSDKIGNKIVMIIGLLQVAAGLIIAYFSKSIYTLILARALQGSGAIIGVGYSWIGGAVHEKKRIRALSILGMVIGFFAVISFGIGPLIHSFLSVKQMFLVCAILIFLCISYILFFIKEEKNLVKDESNTNFKNGVKVLLKNNLFTKLNLAAFINNYIMVSVFYIVPIYLDRITGLNGMWKVFLPAIIIAIVCMKISVKFVEAGYSKPILIASFVSIFLGVCLYFNKSSFMFILIGSILFMIGYVCLSTIIASNVNAIATERNRGVVNGVVNSFQYIGSFIGSVITGLLWGGSQNLTLWLILLVSILGVIDIYSCNFNVISINDGEDFNI